MFPFATIIMILRTDFYFISKKGKASTLSKTMFSSRFAGLCAVFHVTVLIRGTSFNFIELKKKKKKIHILKD